jgi:AcrR family transcriptional regulator
MAPSPPLEPATDTRSRLVAAAARHLDERGLVGLTLREIARTTGVSHGAPLRHFDGLASLLAAVAADSFERLHDAVAAAVADAGPDPLARLRAAGRAYVDFAVERPGPFELMFRPELLDRDDERYLAASWAAFEQLSTLTAGAQATGWSAGVPTPTLAGVLWAGVHGIAALWVQGSLPAATGAAAVDAFVDVFQTDLAHLPDRSRS